MSSWPLLEVAFHVCPPEADASETWVPPSGVPTPTHVLKLEGSMLPGLWGGWGIEYFSVSPSEL